MLKNEILRNVKQSLDAINEEENAASDTQGRGSDLKQSAAYKMEWAGIEPVLTGLVELKAHLRDVKSKWLKAGLSGFYFYYATRNVEIICDKIVKRIVHHYYTQEARRKIEELGFGTKTQKGANGPPRIVSDSLGILHEIDTVLDAVSSSKGHIMSEELPNKLISDIAELRNKAISRNLFRSLKEGKESIDKDYLKQYEKCLDLLAKNQDDVVYAKPYAKPAS